MPIKGQDWEILIERQTAQKNGSRVRTVGRYQVFHNGAAVPELSGTTAESKGQGTNAAKGFRIAAGRYPLATQDGSKYATIDYTSNANQAALRRPGIELLGTGSRSEILIHPGIGFLASIGCINLCRILPDPTEPISFGGSRNRVIAVINDLKAFLGNEFPDRDGRPIPRAFAVIEGEP